MLPGTVSSLSYCIEHSPSKEPSTLSEWLSGQLPHFVSLSVDYDYLSLTTHIASSPSTYISRVVSQLNMPSLSPRAAACLSVTSLLLVALTRLHLTSAYTPFVSFTVYNSSTCTGPLFSVDNNWQWFTALNDSQATVYNSTFILNFNYSNGDRVPNCAANPAVGVVSAIVTGLECMYNGSAGAALNVFGYATPGCATIPSNQRIQIFSYGFNDALTSPNACHAATFQGNASNYQRLNIGITMRLTQQSTPNSAISSLGRHSTTLLWILLVLLLTTLCFQG